MKNLKSKLILFLIVVISFASCSVYRYPQQEIPSQYMEESSDILLRLQVTNHRFRLFNSYDDFYYNQMDYPWYLQNDYYFGYQNFWGFNYTPFSYITPRYNRPINPTQPPRYNRPINPTHPPRYRPINPSQPWNIHKRLPDQIPVRSNPVIKSPIYTNPGRNTQQMPIIRSMPAPVKDRGRVGN